MELDFQSYNEEYLDYNKIYEELANKTLKFLNLSFDPVISVSFVDDDFIKSLNKQYRKIDKITDVISFAFIDSEKNKTSIFNSNQKYILGDIYICLPQAIRQAQEIGNSIQRELKFLFVHGLLHLLGYDHIKKDEEKIMFDMQDKILQN